MYGIWISISWIDARSFSTFLFSITLPCQNMNEETNCSANRSRSMAMFHGTCAFIPLPYVLCVKSWLHISGEEKQFQYCLTRQLSQILQLNPHSKSGLTSHSEPECDDYSCYILMLMFCFSKLAHDLENKEKNFKMQKSCR